MRSRNWMRFVILLLLASFVSGCLDGGKKPPLGTPGVAVDLPPPPKYMGACPPSKVKVGDPPNQAFDQEHAALKECSRSGDKSRGWYLRLRKFYAPASVK